MGRDRDPISAAVQEIRQAMVTKELFRAELKALSARIDGLEKRIDDLKDAVKTYFIVLGVVVAIAGVLAPMLIRLL